jgi:hypothetical protein
MTADDRLDVLMVDDTVSRVLIATPKWRWFVFGDPDLIVVDVTRVLTWFFRARAWLLLGSTFKRLAPK